MLIARLLQDRKQDLLVLKKKIMKNANFFVLKLDLQSSMIWIWLLQIDLSCKNT